MAAKKSSIKEASEEHTSGFALERVPGSNRIGTYALSATWVGWIFYMGGPFVGALIAANMNPAAAITAILAGNVILVIMAVFTGEMGGKLGLSYTVSTRYQFGNIATLLPSIIIWVAAAGWYGVSTGIVAAVMAGNLGGSAWMWAIILGVVMTVMAALGMKVISKFAFFVAPAIFCILIASFFIAMRQMPAGQQLLPQGPFTGGNTWILAFGLTISHFVGGAALNGDVMRFSRSRKAVRIASFSGFFLALNISMFLGVLAAWAIGTTDFFVAMPGLLGVGWKVIALLAIFGIVLTSGDLQCYSAGLALSNLTKWGMVPTVLISGAVGVILAVSGIYGRVISFLTILGIFVPGIPAIMIVDYFILHRQKYPSKETIKKGVNINALIAFVIGAFAEYMLTNRLGVGIFTLNAFFITGILYFVLSKLNKGKVFDEEAPSVTEYFLRPEEETAK